MKEFIDLIAKDLGIEDDSLVYLYMELKTKASDRGSKARRSLGNLYAIYVLCQDFIEEKTDGSRFTDLMARMKDMPFGAKLQNHPLDNRLNDEVRRKFLNNNDALGDEFLPVVSILSDGKKGRKISEVFLAHGDIDPANGAKFIIEIINQYISIINQNQTAYLNEIKEAKTTNSIGKVIRQSLEYESDARLFEIVSHALLFIHYKKQKIKFEDQKGNLIEKTLILYKTGRTNANDGGIDFVLRPLGRFYQVTETLDFKKYFLDFDKMNRYPITFVIKTNLDPVETFNRIKRDAEKNLGKEKAAPYLDLFEEIITNIELLKILEVIKKTPSEVSELKKVIIDNYSLEFGLLD